MAAHLAENFVLVAVPMAIGLLGIGAIEACRRWGGGRG